MACLRFLHSIAADDSHTHNTSIASPVLYC